MSRFGRPFNYQQKGSILLILIATVITITPIMIILSCVIQEGQHPQKVALGTKTAFRDAQFSSLRSGHATSSQ